MDTNLERSPVYQQLNARLRASLAKDYRNGDRFLTEREISESFRVSRATANKALASLVSEGVLEPQHEGTFASTDLHERDRRSKYGKQDDPSFIATPSGIKKKTKTPDPK
jgi:GntR family transcriptional regulator